MTIAMLFTGSMALSWVSTWAVKKAALQWNITDKPTEQRKIHKKPIPLLGGIGIWSAFTVLLLILLYGPQSSLHLITDTHVLRQHIIGLLFGSFLLAIGGFLDDAFNLRPYQQIVWPIAASLTAIYSGIRITVLTNPFGGTIDLAAAGLSDTVTFVWLLTVMYTTKFLDGLDGLVAGITSIGSIIIALLSLYLFINVPTAHLAVIVAGCYTGFLIWNFHPAKIFLGEAGSTLAGFFLGILAIISGAKLATALLILGIPILDAAYVIFTRIVIEHRSPFKGDRKHIHFRLYDMGCSHRQAVMILYCIAAFFGLAALFLQSSQKVTALVVLILFMVLLSCKVRMRSKDTIIA